MSGQVLDQVVDRGHQLAVLLADLQIELALAPKEDLAEVERVESKGDERLRKSDSGWVLAVVVKANKADDALGNVHWVSVVFALLTGHQDIVRVVSATLDGCHHDHAIHAGSRCETLSEDALKEHFD